MGSCAAESQTYPPNHAPPTQPLNPNPQPPNLAAGLHFRDERCNLLIKAVVIEAELFQVLLHLPFRSRNSHGTPYLPKRLRHLHVFLEPPPFKSDPNGADEGVPGLNNVFSGCQGPMPKFVQLSEPDKLLFFLSFSIWGQPSHSDPKSTFRRHMRDTQKAPILG